ncbi:MAG TPA: hypothetical protein VMT00_15945 [Thermoanaerobaculia bacterium]|nr:hypothetical protein [Thermoanaerobaculia bacterium]
MGRSPADQEDHGSCAAAQYALQATLDRFPFHLLLALPYVVTLCILAMAGGMVRPPEYLARSQVERE